MSVDASGGAASYRTDVLREERLDPAVFFRVHRSAIVRLAQVESLLRAPGGDYAVQLKGGARLKVSRSRYEELGQKMGVSK
jgi:two-component system LytT family response regulator